MLPPNKKTARQLLTELRPGEHLRMYDPKDTSFLMTQCSRVGNIYYLVGPQFSIYTEHRLPLPPDMRTEGPWELEKLFEAAHAEGDDEAALVELTNGFMRDHGAKPDDLVFACYSLDDAIATLAGLYATFKR